MSPEVVDLGLIAPAHGRADGRGRADQLAERVAAALGAGALRVEARLEVDDAAGLWSAARAGLRREGVLRAVPTTGGARDLALCARVAGDVDPAVDVLPSIVPLFPTSLLSSGVVLRDPAGRVLLVRTSYKVPWDVPGGVVEDGEGLRAAGRREVAEEIGLDLLPGRTLVLDRCGGDGRQPERLLALLDGGVHDAGLAERLRFPDGEVLEARWVVPADAAGLVGPALAARLDAAVRAQDAGAREVVLLADGRPEPAPS